MDQTDEKNQTGNMVPLPSDRRVMIEFTEGEAGIIQGILEDTLEGLTGVDTPRMKIAKELIKQVLAKLPTGADLVTMQ